MTHVAREAPRTGFRVFVPRDLVPWLLLFAGSGCAALIYEIVWFQLLQFVIGSSAVSLGLLLAAYMGGLCVGSAALPRFAIGQADQRPTITIAVQKISNSNTLESLREQSNVGTRMAILFAEKLIEVNYQGQLEQIPLVEQPRQIERRLIHDPFEEMRLALQQFVHPLFDGVGHHVAIHVHRLRLAESMNAILSSAWCPIR